jgi:L-ascorbate metabolism protein UlaG (beta-lactamase superfamily)
MKQKGSDKMPVSIKWFPPSWFQIKTKDKIIYIDPAWMRTYFTKYPKKIVFSKWPDPIDGLPEKDLEKANVILLTHHHKDHCKSVTVNRLKDADTLVVAPKRCIKELGLLDDGGRQNDLSRWRYGLYT